MVDSPSKKGSGKGKKRRPATGTPTIPDKLYFRIGEVSELVGVEAHVLRYWEKEFKQIRPQRAASNQRLYRRVDVENFLKIKKLRDEDGFTVDGVRKVLAADKKAEKEAGRPEKNAKPDDAFFSEVKSELVELKKMLDEE